MKILTVIFCAALLAGCAGRHPKGTARYDDYDAVKVEQMVGNNVSGRVFERTIVCLNARRETRRVTALTNSIVTSATNATIVGITNQTISIATNFLFTSMTNLAAAAPLTPIQPVGDAPADTNPPPPAASAALSTNLTVSIANNSSGTIAPNQRASNHQQVRTYNNQLTTTTNNLSISLVTNLIITAETNQTVSYVTNTSVVSVTNVIITPTNGAAFDYFLYTEMIPPPDFTLAQGESLILLVDGVRHGFTQGQSATAFVARKGYTSGLYRVPPEVLVAIANAKDVKMRFKGVNNIIERSMSKGSRQHFREFMAKYFAPSVAPETKKMAALEESTRNTKP